MSRFLLDSSHYSATPIDFTRYIDRLTERFTGREWLFEQIDGWLKQGAEQFYLLTGEPGVGKSAIAAKLTQIRSDIVAYHFCRAGDVETVRPGRVLRSLAAQLGKTLPHYGEALAKTIDPIHLRIDVNINIESLSNSQVTGIYIENLKESDPRDELEILLQAPLAALPDLYAEHNEPLPTLKVLLIDSLDEAVTTTGRDNMATLLAALSQTDGLPSWIRFILTARPDLRVLQQFELMKLYKLEELLAQNLEDIERYVGDRVQELVVQPESEFQARLEQAELSAETLVREVKELSKGNFLYTRLLIDGIGTGELSVKNLSILPKTLNEVYQRFLRHRCPFRKWSDRYQSILGTLTVTQEAVTQERLVKFTGVDSKQVQDAIGVLQQFLEEEEGEQGQKLYTIFHQSLREYLLNRKRNHDFWCDAKEQHDLIISCYEKESESWQELRQIDRYGLRHLAQHLVQATRVEELHTLLGLEKEGRNAWFEAKDWIGDTSGFIADVRLAWKKADEGLERQPTKIIGLQCSYALMTTSVNSLANNIPTTLLVALVEKKIWTPEKGLAYARQIPDYQKKAQVLANLADYLPVVLRQAVLQEALDTACLLQDEVLDFSEMKLEFEGRRLPAHPSMFQNRQVSNSTSNIPLFSNLRDESDRAKALSMLSAKLPDTLLPQALEAASMIQHEYDRAKVMCALANNFPEVFLQALETVQAIQDDYHRALALYALTDKFPEVFPQALETARAIQNEYHRGEIIRTLVTKLPNTLLPQTLEATRTIQDEYNRTNILYTLVTKLPDALLPQTLEATGAIQNEYYRTKLLCTLVMKLPDALLPQVLEAAVAIPNEECRAKVLCALANKLPSILPQALEAAYKIQHPRDRAKILCALVDQFPDVLSQVLEIAETIQDNHDHALVLCALIDNFPDLFPHALKIADAIRSEHYRAEVLCELVAKLPSAFLPQLLRTVRLIRDDEYRAKVLYALADKFPNALPHVLEAASTTQDGIQQSRVLYALADKFSNILPHVLEIAHTIQNDYERAFLLRELIVKLPNALLPKALEAVYTIKNEERAVVLIQLAEKFSQIFPQAMNEVIALQQHERSIALYLDMLVSKLPNTLLPLALDMSVAIQDEYYRSDFLSKLITQIPSTLKPKALEAVYTIQNKYYRAKVLSLLANKFPDVLSQALEAVGAIESEYYRAEIFCVLVNNFPEIYPKIIEVLSVIKKEYERAEILCALVDKFPDIFLQALEAALAVRNIFRNGLLSKVILKSPDSFLPQVLNVVCTIQDDEAFRANILCTLTEKISDTLLSHVLDAAVVIRDNYYRAKLLSALADKFSSIFFQILEALTIVQDDLDSTEFLYIYADKLPHMISPQVVGDAIQNRYQYAKIMSALIDKFPDLFPQILKLAGRIHDRHDRTEILEELIKKIPDILIPKLLNDVMVIQDEEYRADSLYALSVKLPDELLLQALDVVVALKSEEVRTKLLRVFMVKLPDTLIPKALDAAMMIQNEEHYFEILDVLTVKSPDTLLSKVLEIALDKLPAVLAIQDNNKRFRLVQTLISQISHFSHEQLLNIWLQTWHSLSNYNRAVSLQELEILVPVIAAIGDETTGAEVANTIQRVCRWWS